MTQPPSRATILVVEDDPDDRLLLLEAFAENKLSHDLRMVSDGEELMEYLTHCGRYADPGSAPRPALILLDLNMPKRDGREVLKQIRSHPKLSSVPVVIMSTSRERADILNAYKMGVSSFITKPLSFEKLVDMIGTFCKYWFQVVELPSLQE